MFEAKFEKKSIDAFNQRIDKMFAEIERQLMNPSELDRSLVDVKDSMRKGLSGIYQNNKYSAAKSNLKHRGMINHSVPFAVTGHLINDMRFSLMNMSPNDIQHSLSFSSEERLRPTQVARGRKLKLDYEASSSSEVALALSARYPLMSLIQRAYEDDFVKHVSDIISSAIRSS